MNLTFLLFGFEQILLNISKYKPSFIVILRDFNARSPNWQKDDITTLEGTQIDSLASVMGL